jgi:hypothetical protein
MTTHTIWERTVLDNPLAFMLIFSIVTMCVSILLLMVTGKEIFHKIFWAATVVFLMWVALVVFILAFSAVQ